MEMHLVTSLASLLYPFEKQLFLACWRILLCAGDRGCGRSNYWIWDCGGFGSHIVTICMFGVFYTHIRFLCLVLIDGIVTTTYLQHELRCHLI